MRRRREFSDSFKQKVVAEINSGTITWAKLTRKYELDTRTVLRWRDQLSPDPTKNQKTEKSIKLESEVAKLERRIGQLVIENDLLKKVLTLARFHSQKNAPLSPSTGESCQPENSVILPAYPGVLTTPGKGRTD